MSRTPRPTFWSDRGRIGFGPSRKTVDETDYEHRHFVNLVAVAVLLLLSVVIVWDVKIMDDNQRIERCFGSGRHDCVKLSVPAGTSILRFEPHHP